MLEQAGFERQRELVDIAKSLIDFQLPQWAIEAEQHLVEDGIRFDYCYENYRPDFLAFVSDNFWENWYRHNQRYVA
ncbi:MAG: hypothetical protein R2932_36285 [Caldilineaceae bacterium]